MTRLGNLCIALWPNSTVFWVTDTDAVVHIHIHHLPNCWYYNSKWEKKVQSLNCVERFDLDLINIKMQVI